MLALSRQKNESIRIDGPCTVTLVQIRGDKVRLGFTADAATKIMRTEIIDRPPEDISKPDRE